MEMIKRNRYLDQISPFIDKDLIKVLIGLRRSGKTILLSQIRDILLDQGVPEKNIIEINFESRRFKKLEDADAFYQEDGRIYYESDTVETRTGIDVSVYQGDIDWEAVKNDRIDFAIIRLGFRGYGESGSMNLDRNFTANLEGAIAAGLDVGSTFSPRLLQWKRRLRRRILSSNIWMDMI